MDGNRLPAGDSRTDPQTRRDPATAAGVPRVELYLRVADADAAHARSLEAGGRELSGVEMRGWGERAGYVLDPDGHVVAFAQLADFD
ncbi:hypothetical protein KDK88_10265 [bacterium]|nr:hypothetical protein [bacterium]HPF36439.1 VOC family protein [Candidatus Krumholzibacteria bacterium]HRX52077.1 VOC family protein [Candidatus Krumholzibacteria bacterium]